MNGLLLLAFLICGSITVYAFFRDPAEDSMRERAWTMAEFFVLLATSWLAMYGVWVIVARIARSIR